MTGRRAQEIHSPFPWVCSAPGRIKADTMSWERGAVKAAPPCSSAVTTEHLLWNKGGKDRIRKAGKCYKAS